MLFLEPVGEGELSPDNFLNFLLRPSRKKLFKIFLLRVVIGISFWSTLNFLTKSCLYDKWQSSDLFGTAICSTRAFSVKPFIIQTLHKSSLSRVRKKPIEVKILEVNHKRPLTSTTLKGLCKNFKKVSDDNSVSPKVAKNTFGVLGQFCLRLGLENCSKWDQENIASPNKIVLQTRKNVSNQ